jgi:hypothetical protein
MDSGGAGRAGRREPAAVERLKRRQLARTKAKFDRMRYDGHSSEEGDHGS